MVDWQFANDRAWKFWALLKVVLTTTQQFQFSTHVHVPGSEVRLASPKWNGIWGVISCSQFLTCKSALNRVNNSLYSTCDFQVVIHNTLQRHQSFWMGRGGGGCWASRKKLQCTIESHKYNPFPYMLASGKTGRGLHVHVHVHVVARQKHLCRNFCWNWGGGGYVRGGIYM